MPQVFQYPSKQRKSVKGHNLKTEKISMKLRSISIKLTIAKFRKFSRSQNCRSKI